MMVILALAVPAALLLSRHRKQMPDPTQTVGVTIRPTLLGLSVREISPISPTRPYSIILSHFRNSN